MSKKIAAVTAAVAMWTASSAWGANLLANPSFETGSFAGWTVSGGSSGVGLSGDPIPASVFGSSVAVKDGTYAAWGLVRGFCCTGPESVTFSQTISVAPGEDYVVGFFGRNQSSTGVGYGIGDGSERIQIFVNGVGLLASSVHAACPLDCFDPSREWIAFDSSFNAGAASSVTVDFRIIASGTGYVGLSADDFYVIGRPVPEPGSLALLGLGLAGLGLSRRRKA